MGEEADAEADEPETYDITISDVTQSQLAMLMGGIGHMAVQAGLAGNIEKHNAAATVSERIMRENPEACRETVMNNRDFIRLLEGQSEAAEILGIEVLDDGTVMDADNVDIEVE